MRLTNSLRDQILERAIAHAFDKKDEALAKTENRPAIRGYKHLFGGHLTHVNALPKTWFRQCNTLQFNIAGQRHTLITTEKLPMPYQDGGWCQLLGVLDGELGDEVLAHANAKLDAQKARAEAGSKLRGMLYSITTLPKLLELWPEGKPFYKDIAGADKTGAVAIRFDDMNKMLGIGKAA